MHIETLRKHRKSLIKARREIKAKLELLDTLLEEAAELRWPHEAFDAFAPERHTARLRAVERINADAARRREEEAAVEAAKVDHAEKVTRPPAAAATDVTVTTDDIDADAEDLIATWCPPTAAEWDAAKAYQTAARNAYRNVMRAVDLDDPVYSKTDMERQRATDTAPPAAPLEEAVRLHATEIRVKTRYPGFGLEWPADRRRSYENIDQMEACSPTTAPTRATAPPDGFLALAPYVATEASS